MRPDTDGQAAKAVVLALLLVGLAAPARAQVLKTRDVVGIMGVFGNQKAAGFDYYDDWYGEFVGGVGFGYYWTEHHRTEVELTSTSEAERRVPRPVNIAGVPPYCCAFSEEYYSTRTISVAQSYQFLHNTWFHPSVAAGVDLEWERFRRESPEQFYFPPPVFVPGGSQPPPRTPIRIPADDIAPRTTMRARPFAMMALKAYFTRHAFVRTDLKLAFRNGVDQVSWRGGVGVDF